MKHHTTQFRIGITKKAQQDKPQNAVDRTH